MDFTTFFNTLAYGAIAIVAMVLGWTVQMVLQLTKAVNTLEANVGRLQQESTACVTDRADNAKHVAAVNEQIALVLQSQEFFGKLLQEVRDSLRTPHSPPPARRPPVRKKAS